MSLIWRYNRLWDSTNSNAHKLRSWDHEMPLFIEIYSCRQDMGSFGRHQPSLQGIYLCLSKFTCRYWCFVECHENMSRFSIIFTRGQLWPSGIVNACVCVCVCPCVCVSLCVKHLLVRAITLDPFKLGSPNLDQRCKIPWLRSCCFRGWLSLTCQI